MKIMVTGANGFVGSFLMEYLRRETKFSVVGTTRSHTEVAQSKLYEVRHWDMNAFNEDALALSDIDVVVHTAGKAHDLSDVDKDLEREYNQLNTDATLRLAKNAADKGVKRFVYLSSIKVNGDETKHGSPFHFDSTPNPIGAYARSKLKAEQSLFRMAKSSGLEVVVIRPTLIYGPGIKGNLHTLLMLAERGIPIPLGAVSKNKRSLVNIVNLSSLITTCLTHSSAVNRVFLVSDNEDLSTKQIAQEIAFATGKKSRVLHVPVPLIALLFRLVGRPDATKKLTSSLQVDIRATMETLAWQPSETVEQGMRRLST